MERGSVLDGACCASPLALANPPRKSVGFKAFGPTRSLMAMILVVKQRLPV